MNHTGIFLKTLREESAPYFSTSHQCDNNTEPRGGKIYEDDALVETERAHRVPGTACKME